jgi:hypothetical protein
MGSIQWWLSVVRIAITVKLSCSPCPETTLSMPADEHRLSERGAKERVCGKF